MNTLQTLNGLAQDHHITDISYSPNLVSSEFRKKICWYDTILFSIRMTFNGRIYSITFRPSDDVTGTLHIDTCCEKFTSSKELIEKLYAHNIYQDDQVHMHDRHTNALPASLIAGHAYIVYESGPYVIGTLWDEDASYSKREKINNVVSFQDDDVYSQLLSKYSQVLTLCDIIQRTKKKLSVKL